jgi:hypothetical protein
MDLEAYRRLPISDWLGVLCPQCDYPLRGLPEHRCPECGLRFEIDDLITPATPLRPPEIAPDTRPVPDLGFACPKCESPLYGSAGNQCRNCGESFDLRDRIPTEPWIEIAPGQSSTVMRLLFLRLRAAGIPCAWPETDSPIESLFGPRSLAYSGGSLRVRHDYYLDALHVLRSGPDPDVEPWICPKCHETVPGNFEICWSCRSAR